VGNGTNLIDIVHVDNAAAAHLQAADALEAGSPLCGSPYFLSQGEPVNCWEWIDDILALADLPPVDGHISLSTACIAGAVLEQVHRLFRLRGEPRMTRFLALQLGRSHFFDISRARRDFGYEPRVSTAEGMARLKRWLPLAKPPINR
jgi:nucleoside-diphosphate-sugar epimerase